MIALLLAAALPALVDVVRISGPRGIAHACPIAGGYLLSNSHVAAAAPAVRWSDGADDGHNEGTAELVRTIANADIAVYKVTRGTPAHQYPVAAEVPRVGDRVVTRGYRQDSRKAMFSERRIETRITRIVAGQLLFEDDGRPGSSGACVLTEKGEAAAINAAGLPTETKGESAGMAVGIWGTWAQDLAVEEAP